MKRAIVSVALAAVFMFGSSVAASAGTGTSFHYFAGTFHEGPNAGTVWNCQGERIVSPQTGSIDIEACNLSGDVTGIVPGTYESQASLGLGTPTSGCPNAALGIIPFFYGGGPTCVSSNYDGQYATKWIQSFVPNPNGTYTLLLAATYANP